MKKSGDEFELTGLVEMGEFNNDIDSIQKGRESCIFRLGLYHDICGNTQDRRRGGVGGGGERPSRSLENGQNLSFSYCLPLKFPVSSP